MRFLLDEHLSPVVARELRRRGIDAVAVAELPDLRGLSDRELLAVADGGDRVLISADAATLLDGVAGRREAGLGMRVWCW